MIYRMMMHDGSTRKDQQPSRGGKGGRWTPRQPRLGPLTLLAVIALAVMQLALARYAEPTGLTLGMQAWLACLWAGWSAAVWMLVRQPLKIGRTIALGAALGWHCVLIAGAMERPAERYMVTFGTYGMLQAIAVVLLGLPIWRPRKDDPSRRPQRPPQFGILSVIAMTTGVAIVMFAARLYGPEAEDGFLSGLLLVSAVLCLVALTAFAASTRDVRAARWKWVWRLGGPFTVAVVASAGAWVPALSDDRASTMNFDVLWRLYASVLIQFGAILFVIGTCGRADAATSRAADVRPLSE